jgi:PAS domain S-box-containing protein
MRMRASPDEIPAEWVLLGRQLAELGIGASLVDRHLRLVWCNDHLRHTAAEIEPAGNLHCFAVHWRRRRRCDDCLPLLVFETGEAQEGYRERQRAGEARRIYRVRAAPLRDATGQVRYVLESFLDVTEVCGDAGVALHDERFSASLAAAGKGVYVVDPLGRIVSWSAAMETILGYRVEEILGREARLLVPRDRWARLDEPSPWSDGGERVECERLAKDGRHVPVAVSTTAIRDVRGEICGYQTLVEDLSELARLRRERRLGERELARIVQASADAIFSTDTEGRVVSWNRGAARILGYPAQEARRLTLADLAGNEAAPLLADFRAGAEVRSRRLAFQHRSGERILLELTLSALEDAEGRFTGLSCIGRDVSARERLEQQIVRSEKLAAVGSLSAGLAHEIGTPLNVISACAEYALLELGDEAPAREELRSILGETTRIRRLVSDLLGFARGGAPAEGTTRPRAAVERVLRLLHVEIERRGIRIGLRAPEDELPPVAANEDAVHQVLLNLLMNALAAVRDGGAIEIGLCRDGLVQEGATVDAVRFRIGDDGPGVPPHLRQRVFDPFYTTRADGTGLGLAVCSRIVADHRGAISMGEDPLGGARVEMLLPVA